MSTVSDSGLGFYGVASTGVDADRDRTACVRVAAVLSGAGEEEANAEGGSKFYLDGFGLSTSANVLRSNLQRLRCWS